MREFIETVFYDLDENADIQKAYEDFEARKLDESIVTYSIDADLQPNVVRELFSDYSFSGTISEERIRTKLAGYNFGLLKMTRMTGDIKDFILNTYNKFKAEEE
jgi:type I restriction enzyme R subunit